MARREATYLANLLIRRHFNQGQILEAEREFFRLTSRNVFSWNILLTGLLHNRLIDRAAWVFEKFPQRNAVPWTALFLSYASSGQLRQAEDLFHAMPEKDIVSWNGIIAAFSRQSLFDYAKDYAKDYFDQSPKRDIASWTSLVTANAKAGHLEQAHFVLSKMPAHTVQSWNAAMLGQVRASSLDGSMFDFDQLPEKSCISWTTLLTAYSQSGNISQAKLVFDLMPCHEICSSTTMITAYGKDGDLETAKAAFDSLEVKDAVLWAAMLGAYSQNGQCRKAIDLFRTMDVEGSGHFFDQCIFVTVLDACADVSELTMGRLLDQECIDARFEFRSSEVAANALVNFYGRCGKLDHAKRCFDYRVARKTSVTWNTIITGYSQNGEAFKAIDAFQEMVLEGIEPNGVTLLGLLMSCGHGGLLWRGINYMLMGISDFGLEPMTDHYVCFVDLLCKIGKVDEVEKFVEMVPSLHNEVATNTLGGGYKLHASFI